MASPSSPKSLPGRLPRVVFRVLSSTAEEAPLCVRLPSVIDADRGALGRAGLGLTPAEVFAPRGRRRGTSAALGEVRRQFLSVQVEMVVIAIRPTN